MTKDKAKYVKACHKCQIAKATKHVKGPMIITETFSKPFDIVCVDTIGPFPRSTHGTQYINIRLNQILGNNINTK